ncbi:uncharacterized protein MYCFIDRAFT_84347 [Pseudocercospora fijiensis CIRAD86]|uniref:Uncharacterized protein n=1 Tax=Pseudocercospora fijiensis (strain CIRAD86) TaxID=383855 RepID=M3AKA5_PSEFD|nr:uncharacterized protein MYCFIDRAFT_84347 [Pseudocercospora fijiensis CIRAD86]EME77598.1 hypothetical protein MYCFIDRAFT_84347 [Pseudocercospora fijiensis CIRAD86]
MYRNMATRERDATRFNNLYQYQGPDAATMRLLGDKAPKWANGTENFWQALEMGPMPPGDPQVWLILCFQYGAFGEQSPESLARVAESMIEYGRRYSKLERDLDAPGILFILGSSVAEDLWYKRLQVKDSDERRGRVLERLRSLNMRDVARPYADVYHQVMAAKLQELRRCAFSIGGVA